MKKAEMKILWEIKSPKNFTRIFEYHDHKFKIKIRHQNGTPIGFNDNCCLMIMTDDGSFKNLTDNRETECGYHNEYILNEDDRRIKEINDKAIKAFYKFVESVY